MKTTFIKDVYVTNIWDFVELKVWLKKKRKSKNNVFFDVIDSTWTLQIIIDRNIVWEEKFNSIFNVPLEASLSILGKKQINPIHYNVEVLANEIKIIWDVNINMSPNPRSDFDIFDPKYTDQILSNKQLYLRNPKYAAIMKFKSNYLFELHRYLLESDFVLIDAPILTKLLLYEDSSAFELNYRQNEKDKYEKMFLSQCCTFQLESAIHAFEKVYNITPSFRAEHSKSNRHLREYWHLKVELAWATLDDLIREAEKLFYHVAIRTFERSTKELKILWIDFDVSAFTPPFPHITYNEAVDLLNKKGKLFEWWKSLWTEDGKIITEHFWNRLVWIYWIPCMAEWFPFKKDSKDPRLARVCDLISPYWFWELLWTAEKITEKGELLERLKEKGKDTPEKLKDYKWYIDLREYGMVPHGWIGMWIERVIRYLLKIPHIRDVISFPRLFQRTPNP